MIYLKDGMWSCPDCGRNEVLASPSHHRCPAKRKRRKEPETLPCTHCGEEVPDIGAHMSHCQVLWKDEEPEPGVLCPECGYDVKNLSLHLPRCPIVLQNANLETGGPRKGEFSTSPCPGCQKYFRGSWNRHKKKCPYFNHHTVGSDEEAPSRVEPEIKIRDERLPEVTFEEDP